MNRPIAEPELRAYTDAVTWLESFIRPITGTAPQKTPELWREEGPLRLARMERLLTVLGRPDRRFAALHVTGTSGKGSVCTYLGAVLHAAGLRTGVHATPYLQATVEKLQIDGRYVTPSDFATLVASFRELLRADPAALSDLPYPALSVGLTYLYFARRRVDAAVIEVSTGGRFDWTNTLQPIVSVVTTVGPDHLTALGPTLADVAYHKAGIIKNGTPAVTGVSGPELAVVEVEARLRGSPLLRLGHEFGYEVRRCTEQGVLFDFRENRPGGRRLDGLESGMIGRYQAFNAALSVAALLAAEETRERVSDEALRAGLCSARLPGRMELIQRHPDVLLDGAHNPQKAAALAASLAEIFPDRRLVLVIGALTTKDATGIIAPFVGQARQIVVSVPHVLGKTGADPERIAALARGLGVPARSEPDPGAAVRMALAEARPDDLICVTGSLYLVGEVRRLWVPDEAILASGSSNPPAASLSVAP
ncbi:MAG TPA: Mur ligase family protein [Dehalococcoidia bacterium]|nr:Mur ligase family protein [Dehalococcoidia bacterium]